MTPNDAAVAGLARHRRLARWVIGCVPLVLLAALLGLLTWMGPADAVRGANRPPVERLAFQRVTLGAGGITATVLNDGPDPVTIAQVMIDDAFWSFEADRGTSLSHLSRTTLTIPYPWVEGEAHVVKILTATGTTFEHEIPVALPTPRADLRQVVVFALIGLYVGVIPVGIGLLWFPLVSRLRQTGLDFLLALTLGLLAFLLVDATQEGLEQASALAESYQGLMLFAFGAVAAYMGLEALGQWLKTGQRREGAAHGTGWVLALLVAVGIGLHNFGEGLVIGAAFALGEVALGTMLVVGFTLHNTTEGVAIVAPLAQERPRVRDLVRLGLIGGVPTIAGAWVGGLLYSPVLSVLFLALGAGAIAQVLVQIGRQMAGDRPLVRFLADRPVMAGLCGGFSMMYATGMLVG